MNYGILGYPYYEIRKRTPVYAVNALGSVFRNTPQTVNPDPAADTDIDGMSVAFTLTKATRVRLTCDARFSKSGGAVRGSFWGSLNGSSATQLTSADTGGGYTQWYSTQSSAVGGTIEGNNQQLHMAIELDLAIGSYVVSAKENASGNTNQCVWGDRSLLVLAIGEIAT